MSAFRFIAAEKANHPICLLCEVLGVSRSGLHAWVRRAPSDPQLADAWLVEQIKEIHSENRGVYGALRIHPSCGWLCAGRAGRNGEEGGAGGGHGYRVGAFARGDGFVAAPSG